VGDILRYPILEDLAPLLTSSTLTHDQSMVEGEVNLTPIQHYFFESDVIVDKHHYNQSAQLSSKARLDKNILSQSFEALVKHHDALRLRYYEASGEMVQYNLDYKAGKNTVHFYDLSNETDWQAQLDTLCEALQSSFDLSEGNLFQMAHFQLPESDHLVFIAHHLIIDGVSWR
ncbi:condensation domain-containing protein, partial [uncultured Kordia sp.]|uniref:condensation domain-containing protein n=1 Tax=uncultured Kordia sp. TaxID=507699 RepID=UPI002607DB2B